MVEDKGLRRRLRMGCITRAGINTDSEVLERMHSAGFKYIWFGFESGDDGATVY